jgi:Protein of unknown function (DUF2510)
MTQPVPGWYPDPSGKPGQMYWDGQRWVPPAGPPQNPVPASLRRRWSALRTRTKMAIVAALAVCVAVWISVMGGGSPPASAPSGQSAPSAPSGQSDSYKAGYDNGVNGSAHKDAMVEDNRSACRDGYDDATANQVHPWGWDDFTVGCMQALQDHPVR